MPYKPHHEVITLEDQVQVYETVAADFNGDVTYSLLKAFEHLKDNRLVPEGFSVLDASYDTVRIGAGIPFARVLGNVRIRRVIRSKCRAAASQGCQLDNADEYAAGSGWVPSLHGGEAYHRSALPGIGLSGRRGSSAT